MDFYHHDSFCKDGRVVSLWEWVGMKTLPHNRLHNINIKISEIVSVKIVKFKIQNLNELCYIDKGMVDIS